MSFCRTTVKEIAAPDSRAIAIGPFGSSLKADLYTTSGVPVVRGQNIKEGASLDESDLVFVAPETAALFPACLLREGDLVFPHRGAIGRVGIVGDRSWLLSSSMMKLTCDPDKADSRYLFYYFRGPGRRELLIRASTVGTPGIGQPLTSLRSIPLLLPPLPEQRAIAEVLGALDDKIAANTKLAAAIDDHLATLFASLLLSGGYEVSCLCDIARVNGGSVKPQPGGTLRYIDIAAVGVGSHAFPDEMTWAEAPGRARRRLSKGDVIWSTVRPNRRSHSLNLSDDPLLVASTGLAVLTPVGVGFAYLYEATRLPGFTTYLENVAEGSAYPAVRADRFNDAPVPLMPTESRWAFESIGEPMREQSHALSQENRTLAATRDALLPQLMSGKLRVKDAEKVAAEVV